MTIFNHSSCKSFYLSCLLFSYLFFNWWHQWVDHRKWSGLKMSHKSTWFELFTSYCKLNDMFTVEYWSSLHVWNALTCVSVPVAHYSLASYSPWQSCNIEELTAFPPALLIALSLSLFFSACPSGFFKPAQGDEKCLQCPINSRTTNDGATNCVCRNGYYRTDSDPLEMPCTSMYLSL